MARFKLVTHTLDPEDMRRLAKIALLKRLSRSALLRILVSNFLRRESRTERGT